MSDPRVEVAQSSGVGAGEAALAALDGVRVVIEADAARMRRRGDQAALYNLVNLAGRLFAHVEFELPGGVASDLALLAAGDLADELVALRADIAPEPAGAPAHELRLAFGRAPSAPGLAADGAGWNYAYGPDPIAVPADPGPALGGLFATSLLVAQAFGQQLAPLGMPFRPTRGFAGNLLTYSDGPAPAVAGGLVVPPLAMLGCGSLGSSALLAWLLLGLAGGPLALVDPDPWRERNQLRYPFVRSLPNGPKAQTLESRARAAGIDATASCSDIQGFLAKQAEAPGIPLALISVDTVDGRRDGTDVLARHTVNAGVAGLALHVAGHGFGEAGCAFCQYVDQRELGSEFQRVAELLGVELERVARIEVAQEGRINDDDAAAIQAAGRLGPEPIEPGTRLADLQRRAYAQATVPTADGPALVSAPFVSMVAGVLMAGEALKSGSPALEGYRLVDRRFDVDLSGDPPAFTQALAADPSGHCLCHSRFRRRAWRRLHGLPHTGQQPQ